MGIFNWFKKHGEKESVNKNDMHKSDIIRKIIDKAHLLLNEEESLPITKNNPYLVDVLHLCIHNPEVMSEFPAKDSGDVGIAFMHVLDLTDESDCAAFQTYSSISFYYMQKFLSVGVDNLQSTEYVKVLNAMIIVMNIGAQSFCRTIACAYDQVPSSYINFNDLRNLPAYVKKVLILEYGYFIELANEMNRNSAYGAFGIGLSPDAINRFHFLKNCDEAGYFDDITNGGDVIKVAAKIRKRVFGYVSNKIKHGEIYFT